MIKALIFDADGTLLDSMKIWMEVTPDFLKSQGKISTPELERKLFSMSLEQGCEYICKEFSLPMSPEEVKAEILAVVSDFYINKVQFKPGVLDFLRLMKSQNRKMCIATAGHKLLVEKALVHLEAEDYFEKIFTCSEAGVDKSKPDIYLQAADYLGAAIKETVVFEDALIPVKTAKSAGFYVVGIEDDFSFKDQDEIKKHCDLFVKDFSEIGNL